MALLTLRNLLPLTLLLASAALLAACSDDPSGGSAGVAIRSFDVTPAALEEAGEVTIRWETFGAASLELLQGDREVDVDGLSATQDSIVILVDEDTTFTLLARGRAGDSASASRTVTVAGSLVPSIASLTAPEVVQADEAGEALATIAWAGVERSTELRLLASGRAPIELDPKASEGSVDVVLLADTTFELLAKNEAGETSRTAAVRLAPLPVIDRFDSERLLVGFGETTRIHWSALDAVHLEL